MLLSGASSFHTDYFQFHLASPRVVSSQNTKEEVTKQRERKSVNVDVRARVCT